MLAEDIPPDEVGLNPPPPTVKLAEDPPPPQVKLTEDPPPRWSWLKIRPPPPGEVGMKIRPKVKLAEDPPPPPKVKLAEDQHPPRWSWLKIPPPPRWSWLNPPPPPHTHTCTAGQKLWKHYLRFTVRMCAINMLKYAFVKISTETSRYREINRSTNVGFSCHPQMSKCVH